MVTDYEPVRLFRVCVAPDGYGRERTRLDTGRTAIIQDVCIPGTW